MLKSQKGMFLISSYLVLSLIGTLSLALFLKSATVYRTTERTRHRITAFHLAESGVDRAIVQLRTDPNYIGQGYTAIGTDGGYDVQVTTPDPIANPTIRLITASGHSPSNAAAAYAYERRQVLAYVDVGSQPLFSYSVFTNDSIQMSGNAGTDSYNSTQGAYNGPDNSPRANGDLGSNTTLAHNIMLSGNVLIKGDLTVGPGATPSSVVTASGNATIQGTQSAISQTKVLSPVVVPSSLNNLGALSVSGNDTVTLPGGTYLYSSITVTGNGKVNFTGPATVYVNGNVLITGNGMTASRTNEGGSNLYKPPNLTLNIQGSRTLTVSGNGKFYGTLYAPNSAASFSGNAGIFGAVIANTLQQSGNAKVHYDEALNNSPSGSNSTPAIQMRSWQEI